MVFFLLKPITQIDEIWVIKLKERGMDGRDARARAPTVFCATLISLTSTVTLNLTDWLSLKLEVEKCAGSRGWITRFAERQ